MQEQSSIQITNVQTQQQFKTDPKNIEREFESYFQVLLQSHSDGTYSVPEWNNHFGWGHRVFTLAELQNVIINCQNLLVLFPELGSFSQLIPFEKLQIQ